MDKFNLCNRRYLGNKQSLLPYLEECINDIDYDIKDVLDAFSGTGVVGEFFLKKGKNVSFNDILLSNNKIYNCFFGNENIDENKLAKYIERYNNIDSKNIDENYFSINFSDTYFSHSNCKKIGYIREDINFNLNIKNNLNNREADVLISSLIYSIDKIANTVGHYDAYIEKKDYLNKDFIIKLPKIEKYSGITNIYRENANNLVRKYNYDLVYIDPPYNSRQYGDLYHLLENIAEWKKPEVFFKSRKMDRTHLKSDYCKTNAAKSFQDLIENIDSKYIVISYNNTGNRGNSRSNAKISDEDLFKILNDKGHVKVYNYNYNSFTTGKTKINNLCERFLLCYVKNSNRKIFIKPDKSTDEKKNQDYIKTPLNYTGNKFKILPDLIKYFPRDIKDRTLIDLFSGGATVGINSQAQTIICNDIQKPVIRLFNLLKKYEIEEILDNIYLIIKQYNLSDTSNNSYKYYNCDSSIGVGSFNKDNYNKLKHDYNIMNESEKKDYIFFVLIVFSFNNQIRFNSKNEFNLPVGKRDFNNNIKNNLIKTVNILKQKNIDFICNDFRNIDVAHYKKAFVYCDPPYILSTATYNENGNWTSKDELDLLNYLENVNKLDIPFMLSNVLEHKGKKHDLLLDWIRTNEFNIIHLNNSYSNSSYNKKDKSCYTDEVIITNFIL